MGYILPKLFLGMLCLSIVFVIFLYKYSNELKEGQMKYNNDKDVVSGKIVDAITNILLVKSFNGLKNEDKHLNKSLKRLRMSDENIIILWAKLNFFQFSLYTAFMTLSVVYCGYLLFDNQIVVSTFVVANSLAINCAHNLNRQVSELKTYFKTAGTIENTLKTILQETDIKDLENAKKLKLKKAEISFEKVNFKYGDGKDYIFKDFDLQIPAKQKLGLVGKSGEGKSSLIKILQRFHDINSGNILFDGQGIKDVTQESLRENISYIPQEPSMFSRSIYDNIAYAKPKATKEEVYKAAKLANADEFIEKLPNKYDEIVGERGFKLSGGQKQRIAIARAILKGSPIIIMDEATSALDSHSEKLIQESLDTLMKDKTCIVIAHRLSTIKNMDRIIVLEDGKIIQDGTHLSLVRKDGIYKQLWNMQYGGLIAEE